jgi:hypothetical protein
MGTAGDNFLRNTLGNGASRPVTASNPTTGGSGQPTPPPNIPPSERGTTATTDIDEATRKAREVERKRVADGPPPWWDIFGLQPAPTGGGSGAQGPGGYKFDAETIAAKITEWEQVRDDIAKDGARLNQAIQGLQAPSPDQPATDQTQATRMSISAAVEHNAKMQQYAQAYIDSLRKANGTYVENEENISGGLYGDTSGTGTLYS